MGWRLSTKQKKSIAQIEYWKKDGVTVQIEHGWRWGHFDYETRPEVDLENEHGVEVASLGDPTDHSVDDGCWVDWTFPDDFDEDEAERLQAIYEEDWNQGLEEEGWSQFDTEYWLHGPLQLEYFPSRYASKPEVVIAIQVTAESEAELMEFCGHDYQGIHGNEANANTLFVYSKEDDAFLMAPLGHWLIKHEDDTYSVCSDEDFGKTYESTWRPFGKKDEEDGDEMLETGAALNQLRDLLIEDFAVADEESDEDSDEEKQ